jgi:hypothetical protein
MKVVEIQLLSMFMDMDFKKNEIGSPSIHWNDFMPIWVKLRGHIFNLRNSEFTPSDQRMAALVIYDDMIAAIGTGEIEFAYPKLMEAIEWHSKSAKNDLGVLFEDMGKALIGG